ncbi:hypothetical protein [Bartonella sp. MM73XJBT]|uniref:hypothetical protein n=1 Tax=Bartonella sp. MM73XJBT TaxID=3019095 RepID=UPI00235F7EE0|nr:hypothetical protein [Bartonella sp. MM73XJBT]
MNRLKAKVVATFGAESMMMPACSFISVKMGMFHGFTVILFTSAVMKWAWGR